MEHHASDDSLHQDTTPIPTPTIADTTPSIAPPLSSVVAQESEIEAAAARSTISSPIDMLRRNSQILSDNLQAIATSASDYFHKDSALTPSTPQVKASLDDEQPNQDAEQYATHARSLLYQASRESLKSTNVPVSKPSPRAKPQRANTDLPRFPDQSFSALHQSGRMQGAVYHSRNLSSQSQPVGTLSTSRPSHLESETHLRTGRVPRTVGSSPANTPGPHSSATSLQSVKVGRPYDHSALTSPYLHPVHAPPARTTTNVNRDYDYLTGRKMINRYELIRELGRGAHGKVKLARDLDSDSYVAIKIVQRHSKRKRLGRKDISEDKVKKEIAILKKVQHPNVVRLIEVIDDPAVAKVYIVLEFCEQRELIWRAEGAADIILMEFIDQSAACGSLSPAAADSAMQKVQRMTKRRRQRQKRERMQKVRKAAKEVDDANVWSLTYVSDSDEDLSVTSSNPQHTSAALDDGFSFYSTEWYQDDGTPTAKTPQPIVDRPRQLSVAESIDSGLQAHMQDEVPRDFKYVPTMTIDECRTAFRDALVGLEYLHYQGIIHRDIKPENLLRTKGGLVKISDFGVSFLGRPIRVGDESGNVSETEATDHEQDADFAKTVGTPAFYPPELCSLDVDVEARMIKTQVDVWALGITLYCMIFARTPFDAENEFALMKRTREEEIFIPRRRLMAIDPKARVRSAGHGPLYQSQKRNPDDRVHEPIDEDLRDLMKKLFQKDPSKRISIYEIKHHPWTIRGINDPSAWIDETDPARKHQGAKIEVSNEDMEKAVVPMMGLDRIKSFGKRALSALGIGGRRKRGQSSATSSEAGSTTSNPRPTTVHQTAPIAPIPQRPGRDFPVEHPLSRSVTASPDPVEQLERANANAEPLSPFSIAQDGVVPEAYKSSPRPSMPDRQASEMSTAASIRTIRASDFERGRRTSTSPLDIPELDEQSRPPSTLSSIFHGAGNSLFRSMGSRDRFGSNSGSPSRSSTLSQEPDHHGEPTSAVTTTNSAPGQLDFPGHLQEKLSAISDPTRHAETHSRASLSGSSEASGAGHSRSSRHASLTALSISQTPPQATSPLARSPLQQSSPANASPVRQAFLPVDFGGGASQGNPDFAMTADDATDEEYRHAKDELVHRRTLQHYLDQKHLASSRPSSAMASQPCPPSPDDDDNRDQRSIATSHEKARDYISHTPRLSMASSDEPSSDMTRSRSTSFPSITSAVSTMSSLSYDVQPLEPETKHSTGGSSDGTVEAQSDLPRISSVEASDDGYQGDSNDYGDDNLAVQSDSDSDSDDGFLTMSRKKKEQPESASVEQKARKHATRAEPKTSRSGSTNTMRKVPSDEPE